MATRNIVYYWVWYFLLGWENILGDVSLLFDYILWSHSFSANLGYCLDIFFRQYDACLSF